MLFNSVEFFIFLPIVFILYWKVLKDNIKGQNFLLLVASYVFYGWWDWRFLLLICFSSFVDYFIGIRIYETKEISKRKIFLFISLFINLGLLCFFKYFNFFMDSFYEAFTSIGVPVNKTSLSIILPVGISFYTFQTLSYSLDIYKGQLEPSKDPVTFFTFVSFFPQLVAGPIERASNLLPQFVRARAFTFEAAKVGCMLILWGMFKKIVIADTCAVQADHIFNNYATVSGGELIMGMVFFAFQIYGDFSGYSDIAIGVASFFGFSLMRNFNYPYFATNIQDFWQRWHISLSTWFRDYIYIPMGGSRCSKNQQSRNIIVTFTISGLWHGANWTFVIWGFLNGLAYLPRIFFKKIPMAQPAMVSNFLAIPKDMASILGTFTFVCFTWVFFRSPTIADSFAYIARIFTNYTYQFNGQQMKALYLVIAFVGIEWVQRKKLVPLDIKGPVALRMLFYLVVSMAVLFFWGSSSAFIYFQF